MRNCRLWLYICNLVSILVGLFSFLVTETAFTGTNGPTGLGQQSRGRPTNVGFRRAPKARGEKKTRFWSQKPLKIRSKSLLGPTPLPPRVGGWVGQVMNWGCASRKVMNCHPMSWYSRENGPFRNLMGEERENTKALQDAKIQSASASLELKIQNTTDAVHPRTKICTMSTMMSNGEIPAGPRGEVVLKCWNLAAQWEFL